MGQRRTFRAHKNIEFRLFLILLTVFIVGGGFGFLVGAQGGTVSHTSEEIVPGTFGGGSFTFDDDTRFNNDIIIPQGGLCVDTDGACSPVDGAIVVGSNGIRGTNAANNNVFLVPTTGRVGIGTSTPQVSLDVAGKIRSNNEITSSGSSNGIILEEYGGIKLLLDYSATSGTCDTACGSNGFCLAAFSGNNKRGCNEASGPTTSHKCLCVQGV